MQGSYVVGIEGGGTTTRVMIADLKGNVLAYKESGSSHPNKDPHAKENILYAVLESLNDARVELADVVYLTAGLPGYEREEDLQWASPLIQIEGLNCPKLIVNDSEVGHIGAFLFKPGIMAIAGTGTMIMGNTEKGQQIYNITSGHYARAAARFLSYDVVYKILAGQVVKEDQPLIQAIMDYWSVKDNQEFRILASQSFLGDRMERDRKFGLMAPILTRAALDNIPLATKICDEAVRALETGIRLVGGYFRDQNVKVCYVGSVIRSTYIRNQLTEMLQGTSNKKYEVVEPILSPVAGAVALSLKKYGVKLEKDILTNLVKHSESYIS